jgi:predicted DNA-binding protein YlxM (UPF0122 family)
MSNKKQIFKYSELLLYYLNLFTKKQQAYLVDYFLHDLSFQEVANKYHISAVAVADSIKRSKQMLNYYEKNLHLYERACQRRKVYNRIHQTAIKNKLIAIDKL